MLRKTLVATTALVVCASLVHAAPDGITRKNSPALAKMLNHAAHALQNASAFVINTKRGSQPVHNTPPNLENAIFSNYSKDANGQFVSWYGYTAANISSSYTSSGGYHSYFRFVGENAFPFTPANTVTTKKVTVPLFSYYPSAEYRVNIYSSVGGLPGNVIAKSKTFTASDTKLCCTASRTVTIKANLTVGTQYFIGVVGINGGLSNPAYGGWEMEDTDFSGAAVDYWHYKEAHTCGQTSSCSSFQYSSPWHPSTSIPATGAVVLK